jgi:hypothetical protein
MAICGLGKGSGLALARLFMHEQGLRRTFGPPLPLPEECSSIGRAPVSKTGGWGFESLHSCQWDQARPQVSVA